MKLIFTEIFHISILICHYTLYSLLEGVSKANAHILMCIYEFTIFTNSNYSVLQANCP